MFNFSGQRPAGLGLVDDGLRPCPDRPNCVCSQAPSGQRPGASPHHVPPLRFEGSATAAWSRLRTVLADRPEATVVSDNGRYLHAEFRSRLMGFVDDLECLLEVTRSEIHLRSASRLGYSDFGVNRARIEELREAFEDAAPDA